MKLKLWVYGDIFGCYGKNKLKYLLQTTCSSPFETGVIIPFPLLLTNFRWSYNFVDICIAFNTDIELLLFMMYKQSNYCGWCNLNIAAISF